MANCFCGCGKKVPLLLGGSNRGGRLAREMVERLQETQDSVCGEDAALRDDDVADPREVFGEMIRMGQKIERGYRMLTHGSTANPPDITPGEVGTMGRYLGGWRKACAHLIKISKKESAKEVLEAVEKGKVANLSAIPRPG